MKIELLVIPDCSNDAAAANLIRTAVADTGIQATISRTIIASQDQARERHFIGSPTILIELPRELVGAYPIDSIDPFARPEAPATEACRLYPTPDGLQGMPGLRDLRQELKRAATETPGR